MPRDLSREIRKRVLDSLMEVSRPPASAGGPHAPQVGRQAVEPDPVLNHERMRVLELLEQGKISAAEAAELLRALGDDDRDAVADEAPRGERPRWFRVRVTDVASGRPKANVSIPFGVVNFGLRFAPNNFRFMGRGGKGGIGMPRQVDDLLDALRSGRRGTLYDITDGNEGERIEIIVE